MIDIVSDQDRPLGPDPTADGLNRLIGYTVIDRDGDKIGSVDCVWAETRGRPACLGVKTGWLGFGRTHLVLASRGEVSDASRRIRVPYDLELVKGAPTLDDDQELDESSERMIYSHYGELQGGAGGLESEPMEPPAMAPLPQPAAAPVRSEDRTIPLHHEELEVGKRRVQAGGVRLRKVIRREVVQQPVELLEEDVVVERIPAGEAAGRGGEAFSEEDVFVPLWREEPMVAKREVADEAVRIRTTATARTETVSDELRAEDVEVVEEERPEVRR